MTDTLHDEIYKLLNEKFPLSSKDVGDYASLKYPKFLSSFRFTASSFYSEAFGTLFLMKGKGMAGKLDLLTISLSPKEGIGASPVLLNVLDLGGNKISLTLEYLDVGVGVIKDLKKVADSGSSIPDYEEGNHWYKRKRLPGSFAKVCTKFGKDSVIDLVLSSLRVYLDQVGEKEASAYKGKKDLVERMVKEGSTIPDTIQKALGDDRYRTLLETLVFPS